MYKFYRDINVIMEQSIKFLIILWNITYILKGCRQNEILNEKKTIFQFCNILKDIRIENKYAKFQREIWKIDEDILAVFVKPQLCSTGRLYAGTVSRNCFLTQKELLYSQELSN